MAVSLDVGNPENVHPGDKQTVGHRLALTALGLVYGDHVEYASPQFREATMEPRALRVWFDNASGLNSNGKPLEDFELAGSDHQFVPATARIEGNTIIVSTPSLADPIYVRYGWSNVVTSWFYNSAGLPGSTFTSEKVPSTDEIVR
jgi:sialate O-acetylesterase